MPDIFDNLTPGTRLLPALRKTLDASSRADFCVGYFNLRGWRDIAPHIDRWSDDEGPCRVLIGMQPRPDEELREALRKTLNLPGDPAGIDNAIANRLHSELAQLMHEQLVAGAPNDEDERTLRRLAAQLRSRRVVVKLFLRHPLHAKLYLMGRDDPIVPLVGYIGSSNLTFSGLAGQGELNIDVLEQDAASKLQTWFNERWDDAFCIDVTDELADIIDASWAREFPVPPYHIYLKMAWHLSNEARAGLDEFRIPSVFGDRLLPYQEAAVKIAARYLNQRGGVLIGDVVGLGKTLMATAVARIFEDDQEFETLILCPRNLVRMWEDYAHEYRLHAKVLSITRAITELPTLRRYRLVIVDESHNLRNRESKRFHAIRDYVHKNGSKCILLSATPYNKTYLDLSSQLRLFLDEEQEIGIRPDQYIASIGEAEFARRHQAAPGTLAAFDHSEEPDDWRNLMRLYLVRRTRSFIQRHYAEVEQATGRRFLTLDNGEPSYFPERVPKRVPFQADPSDPEDAYARMFSKPVEDTIGSLRLPRYGLGLEQYRANNPDPEPSDEEQRQLNDLSRAGKRLMGFCKTNLFKRLESSGEAFLLTLERHALRNQIFLHALDEGLPLPIGSQDAGLLDTGFTDADEPTPDDDSVAPDGDGAEPAADGRRDKESLQMAAAEVYKVYRDRYSTRFNWLPARLFSDKLAADLQKDTDAILALLSEHGPWRPEHDAKLQALRDLVTSTHPDRKILVFSQFADTVRYLERELPKLTGGASLALAAVTGDAADPSALARRFSPISNEARDEVSNDDEIRVLLATDVLSEGQNLQDCSVVVNYDLPWAIIRLIQRAGRVDRIGQKSAEILCYSFLPADGVEDIIELRKRILTRLRENAEVVGADEAFFEEESATAILDDLYNERAGILDDDPDGEVDLASHAYQIWKDAIDADPSVEHAVANLPDVSYSSREPTDTDAGQEGVLVFVRTPQGADMLTRVQADGTVTGGSQFEILAAAECGPETPAAPRSVKHHELVTAGVRAIVQREQKTLGHLGRPSGARHRAYVRLRDYAGKIAGQFDEAPLLAVVEAMHQRPLLQSATDKINRQIRSEITDAALAELVIGLHNEDQLCVPEKGSERRDPRIICSLGLFRSPGGTT